MSDTPIIPFTAEEVLDMLIAPIGTHDLPKIGYLVAGQRKYLLRVQDNANITISEPRNLLLFDRGSGERTDITCYCAHTKNRSHQPGS